MQTVNKKMLKAFEHGLTPIMCCGETLTQREQGVTMDFIRQQVKIGFQGRDSRSGKRQLLSLTSRSGLSEPERPLPPSRLRKFAAGSVSASLRSTMRQLQQAIRIQYGGSVNASDTLQSCFAQADIDGGLVGGASLKARFR